MTNQRTIPNPALQDVVTFDLLSDGQVIDPGYQVISITITREINRIPTARIVFRDGDAAEETFEISNKNELIPGKKIQINIGRDGDNKSLFKGIITSHNIRVRENGQSDLIVESKDESVKLTVERYSQYFEDQKDSEVIESIVGQSRYRGLSVEMEATTLKHAELVQYHSSDWDFILSRADVNGKLVIVLDGLLKIKSPNTSPAPKLTLRYGATLLEFEAGMDARTQWQMVKSQSWDYANQTLFTSETDSVPFAEHGNISGPELSQAIQLDKYELKHSGQVLEEELNQWAQACMLRSRLSKIRGRAKIRQGFGDLVPTDMVDLQGVGERFNGKAFVTAVRQEIVQGQWDTHIQFGLSPEWFAKSECIDDFPAAGLIPAIHGLQIGKVARLEGDPDGQDRIRITLPMIDPNAQGVWARVASLDAGDQRGAFFRPEIGDEVIVGFINDDPRDAIVLGMLNSSAKPAPLDTKDANDEKGFVTRSSMKIHFNDQTKTITISTPAGNEIKMDEQGKSIQIKDQNQNKVEMGLTGIKLESPKNIDIKAGLALSLAAGTTLAIGGSSLSAKADGPISLEGATAKLSAPGITEVTGSLVKIN